MHACAAFEVLADPTPYLRWLEERFGIAPSTFESYRWWRRRGARAVWIAARDVVVDAQWAVEAVGLVAFRKPPPRGYPTTAFVARFGGFATRRVAEVGDVEALALLRGAEIDWNSEPTAGPVVVRNASLGALGRGWIRSGRLTLELRREWRRRMGAANDHQPNPSHN